MLMALINVNKTKNSYFIIKEYFLFARRQFSTTEQIFALICCITRQNKKRWRRNCK